MIRSASNIAFQLVHAERQRRNDRHDVAIINAMVAAKTMEGINGNKAYALPHKQVVDLLRKYNQIK